MKQECTDLFLRYRDMARMIWNVAFWSNADLRDCDCFAIGDYIAAFNGAVARLYEGMVLLPLGHDVRVNDTDCLGKTVPFSVEVNSADAECSIDENLPKDAGHIWTPVGVPLHPGTYEFLFRAFFDWEQTGHREYRYFKLLIQRMDAKPEAVGHHALIPVSECSVWAAPAENSR
jgi:hypothetical protein